MPETVPGASGPAPVDPTANVLALVGAANERQDDLRAMEGAHIRELIAIRAAEHEHDKRALQDTDNLRSAHAKELRTAEAARIDAIRAVDVGAVQQAASVQAAAAQTLATQVNTSAETLRCVAADTPILCVDLVWRPAGDLQVGDELIAVTEDIEPLSGGRSPGRRYVRATVTANSLREDDLLEVRTPLGVVHCNPEHPWLARQKTKDAKYMWVEASRLEPGDLVSHPFDVWETDRSYEAGWLAGIADGEGCLSRKGRRNGINHMGMVLTQVDGLTADAIHATMLARFPRTSHRRSEQVGRQPKNRYLLSNRADVMRLLGSVRPARLLAHSDEVWEGWYIRAPGAATTITSVQPAGRGMIASLTTDTHTYIAGGFAMHNTQVSTTAVAAQTALVAALGPIIKDIADLRRAQYEAQGQKTQVVETRDNRSSLSNVWIAVIAGFAALFSLGVLFVGVCSLILSVLVATKAFG
jgi:hypothetical protein